VTPLAPGSIHRAMVVMAMALSCAGTQTGAASRAPSCERAQGPGERPGDWWCGTTCSEPSAAARCEGPRGRPAACVCTAGRTDQLFAVDRCEALDPERVVDLCAVR
jgi:hypothetical protein